MAIGIQTKLLKYRVKSGHIGKADNQYWKVEVFVPYDKDKFTNLVRLQTFKIHAETTWTAAKHWDILELGGCVWTYGFDELQLALLETQLAENHVFKIEPRAEKTDGQ